MNTVPKDLSYFTLRLRELLSGSFPELLHNHRFINQRSAWAAKAYEDSFMAGYSVERSTQIAEAILFRELHFSPFDTVFKVVCNEFDTLMADEALRPFALKMLPVCTPVFRQYVFTEDFGESPEYNLLYTELTGSIQIWIEDNGLQ